jgi:lipopolysaccharide/colanic/teichoic acid biosynthesis glycosyltransferase
MTTISITQSILYIGNDKNVLKTLFDTINKEIDIYHVESPLLGFAWIRVQTFAPSLILIEQNCKGIDPCDFSQLLTKRFKNKNIRVAVFAENIYPRDISKARENNIVEIFQKPLSSQQANRLTSLMEIKIDSVDSPKTEVTTRSKIPLWKRSFDVFCASLAILLLSPLLILIIVLIKLDSKGPVFYASKRAGRDYKVFNFYKFRTMKVGADKELEKLKKQLNQYRVDDDSSEPMSFECNNCSVNNCTKLAIDNQIICEKQYMQMSKDGDPTFVKLKNDPRITNLGRFLRNTSIDELPQLFNILKGDMSVVGNRPLPLYEAEVLTTDNGSPRFSAPAGLTGLWQVRKRGQDSMSEEERKSLDNEYAENYSFWIDIKLIIQTLGVFIQKENV